MKIYCYTSFSFSVPFYTEESKPYKVYPYTSKDITVYAYTEPAKVFKSYFYTNRIPTFYFYTEPRFNGEDPYYDDNFCKYPTELERIREQATILYYSQIKKDVFYSLNQESYGKESLGGYTEAGIFRVLLDYLSSIWIEKYEDAKSGLARTTKYYWNKYSLDEIIGSFRECSLNAKPIIDLFNLKTYEVIDGDWPSYNIINQITNPPTSQDTLTLRQFRDIYTTQSISANSGEAIHTLSGGQTSFTTTKKIKYLTSFTIGGNDYTGTSVDYNNTSVTYSPSVLFGYNISSSDTVTITYWYEE